MIVAVAQEDGAAAISNAVLSASLFINTSMLHAAPLQLISPLLCAGDAPSITSLHFYHCSDLRFRHKRPLLPKWRAGPSAIQHGVGVDIGGLPEAPRDNARRPDGPLGCADQRLNRRRI